MASGLSIVSVYLVCLPAFGYLCFPCDHFPISRPRQRLGPPALPRAFPRQGRGLLTSSPERLLVVFGAMSNRFGAVQARRPSMKDDQGGEVKQSNSSFAFFMRAMRAASRCLLILTYSSLGMYHAQKPFPPLTRELTSMTRVYKCGIGATSR